MKLYYEAPKKRRIKRFKFFCIQPLDGNLWWSSLRRRWMPILDITGPGGNSVPCHSVRAFQRHVRKHPELFEKGAILVSRYIGHDVVMK